MQSNNRYMRICAKLKDPVILVRIHFLQNLEPLFIPFLTILQREEPFIHVMSTCLHDQLSELVRTIMLRFLKQSVVVKNTGKYMLSVDVDNTDNRLRQEQQKGAIMDMRSFYRTATHYFTSHLLLVNELLHDLAVVQPLIHKEDQSC